MSNRQRMLKTCSKQFSILLFVLVVFLCGQKPKKAEQEAEKSGNIIVEASVDRDLGGLASKEKIGVSYLGTYKKQSPCK